MMQLILCYIHLDSCFEPTVRIVNEIQFLTGEKVSIQTFISPAFI